MARPRTVNLAVSCRRGCDASPHVAAAFATSMSLFACVGSIGGPLPDAKKSEPSVQVVALRFPRLSHLQWEQTVVDLFRLDAPLGLSASFTPDPDDSKPVARAQGPLQQRPGATRLALHVDPGAR